MSRRVGPNEERMPVESVRFGMSRCITAWGFGAAFANLTAGAVYTAFARALGANDFLFGFLAASVPLMSFLQVLTARLIETTGRRKRQMMLAGLTGRSLWIVAALVPLIQKAWPNVFPQSAVLPVFVGCVLLSSALQAFTTPAFFSWLTDLVPVKVRPAFLARRLQTGMFVALLVAVASGWLADNYANISVYCIVLAVAGVAGVMDIALFFNVREPAPWEEGQRPPLPRLWASFRDPMREPAVRGFLFFSAVTMFGLGLQGPFLWLHALENLNFSKTVAGLVLNVAPMLGMACTLGFWGGFVKKHGTRPVQRVCSALLVVVPLGWLCAGADWQWFLFVLTFFSGAIFGGIELCNHSLITGLAPQVPRSTMTALFAICAGAGFGLASCLGGQTAQWLSGAHWTIFGLTFLNYHLLFAASLVVRLGNALFIAPRLHEPTSTATLEALQEIMPELAQSVSARITRAFGMASFWRR